MIERNKLHEFQVILAFQTCLFNSEDIPIFNHMRFSEYSFCFFEKGGGRFVAYGEMSQKEPAGITFQCELGSFRSSGMICFVSQISIFLQKGSLMIKHIHILQQGDIFFKHPGIGKEGVRAGFERGHGKLFVWDNGSVGSNKIGPCFDQGYLFHRNFIPGNCFLKNIQGTGLLPEQESTYRNPVFERNGGNGKLLVLEDYF